MRTLLAFIITLPILLIFLVATPMFAAIGFLMLPLWLMLSLASWLRGDEWLNPLRLVFFIASVPADIYCTIMRLDDASNWIWSVARG